MYDASKIDSRNGLDLDALAETVAAIQNDAAKASVAFRVTSRWLGGTRSEACVDGYSIGGKEVARSHRMTVDEPFELLGGDTAANPQELLMAAFNACIMVGYVANAALRGIALTSVEIETRGELDLRGFLGLDEAVKPGYEAIQVTVRIDGDGTPEQFAEIHEAVKKTSPNYFNISQPIRVDAELVATAARAA